MTSPKGSVLITGSSGGLGAALVKAFQDDGWLTIGVDKDRAKGGVGKKGVFIDCDLASLVRDQHAREKLQNQVNKSAVDAPLTVIVNNAAVQLLRSVSALSAEDFAYTLDVNVAAPFALAKLFFPALEANNGCIINIGSVHAQATKPQFAAYATSKAALHGLTRALAVDLGARVRVNALAPAAIATDMLKAGFEGKPEALAALEKIHPSGRIASASEIARLALFLASKEADFINGATLYADGGVLSRLHDPL